MTAAAIIGVIVAGVAFIGRFAATDGAHPVVETGPVGGDSTPLTFVVPPGATATDIGERLERAGLIRSAAAFRVFAERRGVSAQLRSGEFELSRDMSVADIIDVLAGGPPRRGGLVTIPEGWRAEEIARRLAAAGVVDAADFLEAVAGRGVSFRLPDGASLFEGYLFPDSYDLGRNPTPESVLQRFVQEFDRKVGPDLRAQAARRQLTVHELVTLASIVEREAVDADERFAISAVYHNRLARGMMLQADPTTQYALVPFGELLGDTDYWKRDLTLQDLRKESPYNTYRVAGLPPGPIANPGLASLEAAANPSPVRWLYFVAQGGGKHLFAETLDEHVRNVARVGG